MSSMKGTLSETIIPLTISNHFSIPYRLNLHFVRNAQEFSALKWSAVYQNISNIHNKLQNSNHFDETQMMKEY